MNRVAAALCAVVLAWAWAVSGAQQQSSSDDTLALTNAHVVDVRGGKILPRATVLIRGTRIESTGAAAVPSGARVLDLRGKYLVPGLIDAHVHITTLRGLKTAAESGVTTLRSSGVSSYLDVGMRQLVQRGAVPGAPEMVASGYHVRPRLADEAYMDAPSLAPYMATGIVGEEAIRQVVRANLARGVDWIKVLATERAGTADTDPRKQVYTEAELRAAVEEAAAKNVPVQAHAHGDEGALAAVRAGVRSIEHGTYLADDTLRLMHEKGVYLVPTYTTVVDLVEPGGDYDVPALRIRGRHMLARLGETVQRAHKLGVKIVTGGDTSYGPNSLTRIAQEVANFVELGMSPLHALQAATITAAEMLRIDGRTGAILSGREADLMAVERNPLDDPRVLQDALLVISNGQVAVNRLDMEKKGPGTE